MRHVETGINYELSDIVLEKAESMLPVGDPARPTSVRDAAMLSLMLMEAMTPAELGDVLFDCLSAPTTRDFSPAQVASGWPDAPLPSAIRIPGLPLRPTRERSITLSAQSAERLQAWLRIRGRAAHSLGLPTQDGAQGVTDRLFFSFSLREKDHAPRAVTNVYLWSITSSWLKQVVRASGYTSDVEHVGPMTLRTARIRAWLDKDLIDPIEVARRAGLDAQTGLYRFFSVRRQSLSGRPQGAPSSSN